MKPRKIIIEFRGRKFPALIEKGKKGFVISFSPREFLRCFDFSATIKS